MIVLYGINLVPLDEELRAADLGLLHPLYADDAVFEGSTQRIAQLLKMLMERGPEWGYFPDLDKSLFISDAPGKDEATKREFTAGGMVLNFLSGSRYLGAYLGP